MNSIRPNWGLSFQEQMIPTVIFGLLALLSIAYAVRFARRQKTRYPYFLVLGTALTVVWEPFTNVLGQCTYPEIGQITLIEELGRKIPLYMGFFYMACAIWPVLWIVSRLEAGITESQWWKYYGVGLVLATLGESIPLHFGWWGYYGEQQPLWIPGFPPAWWWFANAQCVLVAAGMVHLLRKCGVLSESRSFLLVPLFPMLIWCTQGSASMPIFATLTSTMDIRLTTAASLLTMLMALMNVWISGRLVTRPSVSHGVGSV